MVIKGRLYITGNLDTILTTPEQNEFGRPVRILNMNEDNVLDATNNPLVVNGTVLLPPVEAKIAEADGNEMRYDQIYSEYLLKPYPLDFVTAILALLYTGGDLLIYLPDEDYTNTRKKFIQHFAGIFGITIGVIGEGHDTLTMYDMTYIPFWLNLLYKADIIAWDVYLLELPEDAYVGADLGVINKLVDDIHPYLPGASLNTTIRYFVNFHRKIHKNNKLKPAIVGI